MFVVVDAAAGAAVGPSSTPAASARTTRSSRTSRAGCAPPSTEADAEGVADRHQLQQITRRTWWSMGQRPAPRRPMIIPVVVEGEHRPCVRTSPRPFDWLGSRPMATKTPLITCRSDSDGAGRAPRSPRTTRSRSKSVAPPPPEEGASGGSEWSTGRGVRKGCGSWGSGGRRGHRSAIFQSHLIQTHVAMAGRCWSRWASPESSVTGSASVDRRP